ncbi:MAG: transcriptional regulator [Burkholderiales bacterium]|jgi:hypothetical protein|nr:transcriptional regulator [Burkholderiales bacterium]
MLPVHPRKVVVIITESALEPQLVKDVRRLGAQGYTIADVRGGGKHGDRDNDWERDRNIRMEVVCDEPTADAIARHMRETHAPHWAMTILLGDIGVLRPEKF